MGARNTKEQTRAYTLALRERRQRAGLVRKEIWIHPHDWPAIKSAVKDKAQARECAAIGNPGNRAEVDPC